MISEDTRIILEYIYRYEFTTAELLAKALFREASFGQALLVLQTLAQEGLLKRYPLIADKEYYQLTPPAFPALGKVDTLISPMYGRRLKELYGLCWSCCQAKTLRSRLLPEELHLRYPELAQPGMPHCDYYFEAQGEHGLVGICEVDTARDSKATLHRCLRLIRRHAREEMLADSMQSGEFAFTLVTGDRKRRTWYRKRFEEQKPPLPLKPSVVTCTELPLLP